MVLSKLAVQKFKDRPCRDSSKAKRFTERALDRKLEKLGAFFHTEPRVAQKICYLLGWHRESYLFLMGMGGGKTKVSLDLFVNRMKQDQAERLLVLVPYTVNLGAWKEEVQKHAPQLKIGVLDQSGKEARTALVKDFSYDVVVATYNGFVQLCSKKTLIVKTGKNKWVMDPRMCDDFASCFEMLVLDESSEVKNHTTVTFKVMRRLANKLLYRFALTGTPFDKDVSDLWSQFYLIDGGWALGETLGLYRSAFFNKTDSYWGGGYNYTFKKSKKKALHRRLRHSSIRFREDECQDLPDYVGGIRDPMIRPVQMPAATWAYYEKLLDEFQNSLGNYELMDNTYTRMRMLASGYLVGKDADDERVEIVFPDNPKLDALEALLKEIPEEEKVVVVHIFNRSGRLCAERLEKAGIPFAHVYGKTPKTKKNKLITDFKESKGPRVLLGSEAIAYGLNLQEAAGKMIFFESPDSNIPRTQIEKRIVRGEGHFDVCYIWDLVVEGTVDRKILEAVQAGKSLLDYVLDLKKNGKKVG